MAGKLPWMKFYPGDWILDMDRHPLEIEGAWIRICCHLHRSKTYGKLSMTLDEWADVLRVDKDKTKEILRYLCVTKIATSRTDNGNVTVECRRMIGDDKDREQNKMRQQRYRDKHSKDRYVTDESRKNNGEETRVQRLETRDQRLENKNNTPLPPLGDRVPYQKIVDIYHEELPSLASVRVVGDALKKSIRARCREAKERLAPEWWSNFFRSEVSPSDWLMGRTKDWEANLAWIVTRSKFEKIVNGGYRNKKVKQHPAGRHPGDCGAESQEEPKNTRGSTQAREAISEAIRKVASSTGQI